jgi:hypothetical protein
MDKDMKNKKMKDFKIETFDGGGYMTFVTSAGDHKKALRNLQTHSSDFKHICNKDKDLTIKVIEIVSETKRKRN